DFLRSLKIVVQMLAPFTLERFSFGLRQNENSKLLMGLIFCFQMSTHSFENRYKQQGLGF
ncbi:MAG: hypothetical protein ACK45W_19280, partial [Pseudanabaena sp.]